MTIRSAVASRILPSTKCVLPCIPCCVQGLLVFWSAAFIGVSFAGNFLESRAHFYICRLPRKNHHHTVNPRKRLQKCHQRALGSIYVTDHLNLKCFGRKEAGDTCYGRCNEICLCCDVAIALKRYKSFVGFQVCRFGGAAWTEQYCVLCLLGGTSPS